VARTRYRCRRNLGRAFGGGRGILIPIVRSGQLSNTVSIMIQIALLAASGLLAALALARWSWTALLIAPVVLIAAFWRGRFTCRQLPWQR
jgi:hypothetical protein